MDAEGDPAQLPDLDQAGVLDVVDHDPAAKAARKLRRNDPELLEIPLSEPAGESPGDEQGLVLDRDAGAPELVDYGPDRRSPRIVLRAGFLPVNVLDEKIVAPITALVPGGGLLPDPGVLVFQRPGTLVTQFAGFADRDMVAQAAVNAIPPK